MKQRNAGAVASWIIVAVAAAVIALALILPVSSDLGKALTGFYRGAFGSTYSIAEVLVKAAPLILCGLSVAVGFHSGFTNIGAEGQFYMGAVVATYVGMYMTSLPGPLALVVALVLGFLAGGVWAMVPGILRARFGISEVINTIMFNYIALGIVGILLQTSLKASDAYFPVSAYIPEDMWLATLRPGTRLHGGLIVALVCAAAVYVLIWRSYLGYQIRAVGLNPRACQCAGIPVGRSMVLSSLISGGLAGLAGVCEIAGLQHRLLEGISPGYGYLAIVVALLGRNSPVGIVIASVGVAVLQVGAQGMQRSAGVPTAIANIMLGCVVLLILARPMMEKLWKGGRK